MNRPIALSLLLLVCAAGACNKTRATPAAPTPPAAPALKTSDLQMGNGPVATRGKVVQVRYTGYLPDGTRFDSNVDRQPLQFQLGQGTVLKGWDLGIEGMKVGGKRKLTVPPSMAFGDRTVGQIKPNSTLTFEVELVAVK